MPSPSDTKMDRRAPATSSVTTPSVEPLLPTAATQCERRSDVPLTAAGVADHLGGAAAVQTQEGPCAGPVEAAPASVAQQVVGEGRNALHPDAIEEDDANPHAGLASTAHFVRRSIRTQCFGEPVSIRHDRHLKSAKVDRRKAAKGNRTKTTKGWKRPQGNANVNAETM